eukprot:scaffold2448_cov24-Cyclotella_meneghiniana.AAC.3
MSDQCASCGKADANLKACTACKLAKYCGVDCQVAHRPAHKRACKKRARELFDVELYAQPPKREECPICMIPLPCKVDESSALPCSDEGSIGKVPRTANRESPAISRYSRYSRYFRGTRGTFAVLSRYFRGTFSFRGTFAFAYVSATTTLRVSMLKSSSDGNSIVWGQSHANIVCIYHWDNEKWDIVHTINLFENFGGAVPSLNVACDFKEMSFTTAVGINLQEKYFTSDKITVTNYDGINNSTSLEEPSDINNPIDNVSANIVSISSDGSFLVIANLIKTDSTPVVHIKQITTEKNWNFYSQNAHPGGMLKDQLSTVQEEDMSDLSFNTEDKINIIQDRFQLLVNKQIPNTDEDEVSDISEHSGNESLGHPIQIINKDHSCFVSSLMQCLMSNHVSENTLLCANQERSTNSILFQLLIETAKQLCDRRGHSTLPLCIYPDFIIQAMQIFARNDDEYKYGSFADPIDFFDKILSDIEFVGETCDPFYTSLTVSKSIVENIFCSECKTLLKFNSGGPNIIGLTPVAYNDTIKSMIDRYFKDTQVSLDNYEFFCPTCNTEKKVVTSRRILTQSDNFHEDKVMLLSLPQWVAQEMDTEAPSPQWNIGPEDVKTFEFSPFADENITLSGTLTGYIHRSNSHHVSVTRGLVEGDVRYSSTFYLSDDLKPMAVKKLKNSHIPPWPQPTYIFLHVKLLGSHDGKNDAEKCYKDNGKNDKPDSEVGNFGFDTEIATGNDGLTSPKNEMEVPCNDDTNQKSNTVDKEKMRSDKSRSKTDAPRNEDYDEDDDM